MSKKKSTGLVVWLKSIFLFGLYRFLIFTWRIRIHEEPGAADVLHNHKPGVLVHWHGDEYSLIHMVKTYSVATMTSTSQDGEVVNYLIRKLGGKTSRGSSTRGAVVGLKGLVRLLREGNTTSIAVDGPRGPRRVVKPGAFELAKLAKAAILPVGVHVKSALRFEKAWNKAYLPLPFAKIQIVIANPLKFSFTENDPRDPNLAESLARAIDDASSQARGLFYCDA